MFIYKLETLLATLKIAFENSVNKCNYLPSQWASNLFCRGPESQYFRLCGQYSLCSNSALQLWGRSSCSQYINEWVWLCPITKIGAQPDFGLWVTVCWLSYVIVSSPQLLPSSPLHIFQVRELFQKVWGRPEQQINNKNAVFLPSKWEVSPGPVFAVWILRSREGNHKAQDSRQAKMI